MARVVNEYTPEVKVTVQKGTWNARPYTNPREADFALEELKTLIRRHVVPHWDGSIELDWNYGARPACSHCGADWTEKGNTYNGGCCQADEDEFAASTPSPAVVSVTAEGK